jgi:alpha-glucosidase
MKGLVATGYLIASASAAAVLATRDATTCPGYKATNVKTSQGSIVSADLSLAGAACNVYGTDLDNLVLQVEYETGRKRQSKNLEICYH